MSLAWPRGSRLLFTHHHISFQSPTVPPPGTYKVSRELEGWRAWRGTVLQSRWMNNLNYVCTYSTILRTCLSSQHDPDSYIPTQSKLSVGRKPGFAAASCSHTGPDAAKSVSPLSLTRIKTTYTGVCMVCTDLACKQTLVDGLLRLLSSIGAAVHGQWYPD